MADNLDKAKEIIFKESKTPEGIEIEGFDFDKDFNFNEFFDSYASTGAQASHLHQAKEIMENIIEEKKKGDITVFLGYTSNMVTTGVREIIRFLVKHNMVDIICTTAGGIEEDIIKTMKPFILGDFKADGSKLREMGINRAGNIFIPNDRYVDFEKFVTPILEELIEKQEDNGGSYTPSEIVRILGERVGSEDSIYYWAAKNNIPVICPGIIDGSLGDIIFFFNHNKEPKLKIDVAEDNSRLNKTAINADKTGLVILGGGIQKHQILNANMMREGADYAVYINTAQEYDGSDTGARPEEAKSWGKLNKNTKEVKVYSDATIAFPLIVASLRDKIKE